MTDSSASKALIVGAGAGLSGSLARLLASQGVSVALAARNTDKLSGLVAETGASAFTCDVADRTSVEGLFRSLDTDFGVPDLVVYNPSYRARGAFMDIDPDEMQKSLQITAFGGYLVSREAVGRMLRRGSGAVFFTGASASVKGYPQSASFAMGKAALRGLAQSLARELQPKNIHFAHFVIDGGIASERRPVDPADPDALLDPDAIAQTYLDVWRQHRSAWSLEVELRPFKERF